MNIHNKRTLKSGIRSNETTSCMRTLVNRNIHKVPVLKLNPVNKFEYIINNC